MCYTVPIALRRDVVLIGDLCELEPVSIMYEDRCRRCLIITFFQEKGFNDNFCIWVYENCKSHGLQEIKLIQGHTPGHTSTLS